MTTGKRTPLSIEDKDNQVLDLINIGKQKGYLLYDEVNELLPSEINSGGPGGPCDTSAAPASKCWSPKGVPRRQAGRSDAGRLQEGGELELTPGALEKTNDPVRMYLREMGTVPLLTREGEVAIAKRIERGKLG